MNVMHFNSPEERMAFLKGKFEEIKPQKADIAKVEQIDSETEEKPRKKKAKGKKND